MIGNRGQKWRVGPGKRHEEKMLRPRPKSLCLGGPSRKPRPQSSMLWVVTYSTPLPRQTPALSSRSSTRPATGPARQILPKQTRKELVPERPAVNQKSAASGDRRGQVHQAKAACCQKATRRSSAMQMLLRVLIGTITQPTAVTQSGQRHKSCLLRSRSMHTRRSKSSARSGCPAASGPAISSANARGGQCDSLPVAGHSDLAPSQLSRLPDPGTLRRARTTPRAHLVRSQVLQRGLTRRPNPAPTGPQPLPHLG